MPVLPVRSLLAALCPPFCAGVAQDRAAAAKSGPAGKHSAEGRGVLRDLLRKRVKGGCCCSPPALRKKGTRQLRQRGGAGGRSAPRSRRGQPGIAGRPVGGGPTPTKLLHCKSLKLLNCSELEQLGISNPPNSGLTMIPERDVYRLVMRSKLPAALFSCRAGGQGGAG